MGSALLTDLYELNMAASYLRRGMDGPATFSLFVRDLPPSRGFLVAAGLESCLDELAAFAFEEADLAYLAGLGFTEGDLDRFRHLRFTGEVWAVPEGRVVFADEPLLEVTAPIAEAQLAETYLLNQITLHTTLASKAARVRLAAAGRDVVDFSFRRTQGIEAAAAVARACAIVGFQGTSNVEAARTLGIAPSGTMAHSYVETFPDDAAAFRAFAEDFPGRTTFLVDTYDTLGGVRAAIETIRELGITERAGIRIDSGDLDALAREARAALDGAGLPWVRIFASGGLDEMDVHRLVAAGAPIDAFGVGTRMGVSADAPYLDTVYKLVEYEGRPAMKLSVDKATAPGAKQVFRGTDLLGDVVGLRDEEPPPGTSPLLEPVMRGGRRTAPPPTPAEAVAAARSRFEADLALLPPAALDLAAPVAPRPAISEAVRTLTARSHADLRLRGAGR